jgi:hypothetical protein
MKLDKKGNAEFLRELKINSVLEHINQYTGNNMCKEWTGVVFFDKWWPIVRKAKGLLEDPLNVGERP